MAHIIVPLFRHKKNKIKRFWNMNEFVRKLNRIFKG